MLKSMCNWRQNCSFHREDRNSADPLSDKIICMCVDNYSALLSGIYNLKSESVSPCCVRLCNPMDCSSTTLLSCKITPLGSELFALEESSLHKT